MIDTAFELHEQSIGARGHGQLGRIIREIVEHRGPSNKLGARAKVYFASQVL
ncbi:MAG: hypothetical protein R3B49_00125 [Phycisphaerales bacterium]